MSVVKAYQYPQSRFPTIGGTYRALHLLKGEPTENRMPEDRTVFHNKVANL